VEIMAKYIFTDLDGTLLQDFYKIDNSDIKALQKAQSEGVKISVATGRLDYEISMLMEKYNLHGYRISQNGAVVYDDQDNLVHETALTVEEVKLILNALKEFNVLIFFQTPDAYIIPKMLPLIKEFEDKQSFITYIENQNILNELDQHDIITISLWAEKDQNVSIKTHLNQILPSNLINYISSDFTLDITNKANSKGNAILNIAKKFGIPTEEIAVIGDSQNDISMFNITTHSFVMANAKEDVKQHAKYVVNSVKDAVEIILSM
jgi:Cof subfamily protein (haloacid dehalogenase superfamily)